MCWCTDIMLFQNPPYMASRQQLIPRIATICIEIEIEIVYNMYRMRRFFTKSRMRRLLSLGPPNYAIQGTYKSGLDR